MQPFEGARSELNGAFWDVLNREDSPDYELENLDTLPKLRSRSSKLIKNNLIAAGVQQAYINAVDLPVKIDVTTKMGITPSRIQEKQANEFIESALKECDGTKTRTLDNLIEEIVGWAFAHGDLLINLPLDKSREGIQTTIELIEASRIKTPNEHRKNKNVRLGVEYHNDGRIKGYWVIKADKVDCASNRLIDFDFYPMYRESGGLKRKVTFLFKAPLCSRPKASRQYPLLTPCITLFKMLKDYEEAVIVGARVAACFSVFVLSGNPAASQKSILGDPTSENTRPVSRPSEKVSKVKPGMVTFLDKEAQDVKIASPNLPGDNVDRFRLRNYKLIAMYTRLPYEILFLDLSEANYSSWKGATIETKKMFMRWRRELNLVIEWYLKTVLTEASLRGLIRGDLDILKIRVRWPASGFIDPEKENRSNRLRLQNKTASVKMLCEEEGNDYLEIQQELEEEAIVAVELEAKVLLKQKELEEKHGIIFPENKDPNQRQTGLREGESGGPSEEDKKERRKEDGNW